MSSITLGDNSSEIENSFISFVETTTEHWHKHKEQYNKIASIVSSEAQTEYIKYSFGLSEDSSGYEFYRTDDMSFRDSKVPVGLEELIISVNGFFVKNFESEIGFYVKEDGLGILGNISHYVNASYTYLKDKEVSIPESEKCPRMKKASETVEVCYVRLDANWQLIIGRIYRDSSKIQKELDSMGK